MITGTVTTKFVIMHCCACGVLFAVPEEFNEYRRKDDKPDESLAGIETRRELVLALHRAEQAEAKAADACSAKPTAATGLLQTDARKRLLCPHCNKPYCFQTHLQRHLVNAHNDAALAQRIPKLVEALNETEGEQS